MAILKEGNQSGENGALLHGVVWSWKMIPGGHGKLWKSHGKGVRTLH